MRFHSLLPISVALSLMVLPARSEISLAPLFSDHVVLQRDKPLPVWGRATPGEKISV